MKKMQATTIRMGITVMTNILAASRCLYYISLSSSHCHLYLLALNISTHLWLCIPCLSILLSLAISLLLNKYADICID